MDTKKSSLADISDLKTVSVDDFFEKLSSSKNGLSSSEANNRISKYGLNEIKEKKINPVRKFLGYFSGPIPWMIEAALIISAMIEHWEDFLIIFVLLLSNAIIGFWHEHKAENAIELLKQKMAIHARVLRDGKWLEIPAKQVVPGDIIRVRFGDIIPADMKLFGNEFLLVDESSLTGESLPVEKTSSDLAYSGSLIHRGESNGLVITTGSKTFFGKTAQLVQKGKTVSHFQKALKKIGNYLIFFAVALVSLIFIFSFVRQQSMPETLQFALVLTVAAIPVALPAVLSVSMAIGASILAKKKAIVSKLAAVEELAGMDVLCCDKTGTLTQNNLVAGNTQPVGDHNEEDVLLFASLASREENKDPIDMAIIKKTKEISTIKHTLKQFQIKSFKPFDPIIKRSESLVLDSSGNTLKITKGAPQVILSLVPNKEQIRPIIEEIVNTMAKNGYRAIAVAKTDSHDVWQFMGIIPLFDPPREDAVSTIREAISMGVNIKMVTGDHISIAKQIASKLGLGTNISNDSSILEEKNHDSEKKIEEIDGFAQVFPEHKFNIIESLQDSGHIVGMTGDGANDAPALKKADVGIAVANSTDVAKSAADIVLTGLGISVIIDSIKESRKIFQRMKNYAIYRIGETIRILLFLTASIIAFNFYPISAVMIVLLALLNDIPIMTIAFDKVRYSNNPERWNMRNILLIATILGTIGVVSSFILLYIGKEILLLNNETLQSFIYLKLSVAGQMFLFVARTRRNFWTVRPAWKLLLAVMLTQTTATLITVYGIIVPPIGWDLALLVWAYTAIWFVMTDFGKILLYKFIKP